MRPPPDGIGRLEAEAGCFVLLPQVPTAGDLAPRARERLTVSKKPQGPEQHDGCRKDPVMVKRLFLQKPERIEALGWGLWLLLLLGRLMERALRRPVDTPRPAWPGWDKQVTERLTACMMVTTGTGVIVVKCGHDRHLARPRSAVQPHSLLALDVPATYCTLPAGGQRTALAAQRLSRRQKRILQW
jgi:hypothetical protein